MSIDDLLAGLHQDTTLTINEQVALLELEMNKRRLIGAEIHLRLFERLQELTTAILLLQPEHEQAFDAHRNLREPLERERRQVEREINAELTGRWRDLQPLETERRRLRREQRDELHRYERHTGHYDA